MINDIPHKDLEDQKAKGNEGRPADFVDDLSVWQKVKIKTRKATKKIKQTIAGETTIGRVGSWIKDGLTFAGVLPKFINKASDVVGAQFKTKDRGTMSWIANRLQERSTWRGLVGIATALGLGLQPEQVTAIVSLGVAAAAAVEVFFKEPQSKDAK